MTITLPILSCILVLFEFWLLYITSKDVMPVLRVNQPVMSPKNPMPPPKQVVQAPNVASPTPAKAMALPKPTPEPSKQEEQQKD
jgi:hypothetical protein